MSNGRASRNKGARGQAAFRDLLHSRDWRTTPTAAGVAQADIDATCPDGNEWCVEVKNTSGITDAHRRQAMRQAQARGRRWMLAWHIPGTGSWLVQRQGWHPVVWRLSEWWEPGEVES